MNESVTKESTDFKPQSGNSTDTPDGQLTSFVDQNGNVQNPAENTTNPPRLRRTTKVLVPQSLTAPRIAR